MTPRIREGAALLLMLCAAGLAGAAVAYQLRGAAVARAADLTSSIEVLESLRGSLGAADTVGYRLCELAGDVRDSSVALSRYYLAQYALAPAIVDTSVKRSSRHPVLVDEPRACAAEASGEESMLRLELPAR